MTITPSGSPPWMRVNSLVHYGGDINKENYLSRGAIDALTDVDAAQFSRLAADVAALQRVMPFCTMTFLCSDSSPAAPTVEYVHMQTGNTSIAYLGSAPTTGFPSLARNDNGDVSITFASTYSDPYGVSGTFAITSAIPSLIGSTAGEVVAEVVSSTVLRIRAYSTAGVLLVNPRITVSVW